jgi:hypothetical protein
VSIGKYLPIFKIITVFSQYSKVQNLCTKFKNNGGEYNTETKAESAFQNKGTRIVQADSGSDSDSESRCQSAQSV